MNTIEKSSALADVESVARNRLTDFAAFEASGSVYFAEGCLEEAMTAYQHAIGLNPGAAYSARAFEKIGWIHYLIGTPQQAIAAFEQAISNDPHFISAYDGLGWLYISKLADYGRAIHAYERGLAANPGDPYLTAYLGSTYARMGQTDKALEILEQSAKDHPDQAAAPNWLSYLYFRLNRLDEAANCCRREIELREVHSPHRVLGFIYQLQDRKGDAIAELERAIALEPIDYEARAALANLYRESGDLPAADTQYNTGLEMAGQDEESGLACFHAVYGSIDQALGLLETGCAKGQLSPGWIRIDPELYFLQNEPRFQALIDQEAQ